MRSRAERADRNVLLPEPRAQFVDPRGGVLTDPLRCLDEVAVHVDLARPAGGDQAVYETDLLGAEFGSAVA
jgi:hypothetical protein